MSISLNSLDGLLEFTSTSFTSHYGRWGIKSLSSNMRLPHPHPFHSVTLCLHLFSVYWLHCSSYIVFTAEPWGVLWICYLFYQFFYFSSVNSYVSVCLVFCIFNPCFNPNSLLLSTCPLSMFRYISFIFLKSLLELSPLPHLEWSAACPCSPLPRCDLHWLLSYPFPASCPPRPSPACSFLFYSLVLVKHIIQ